MNRIKNRLEWALVLVIVMVVMTVYFNTGWAIGTYIYNHVQYVNPPEIETTIVDKFLAGPKNMMSTNYKNSDQNRWTALEMQTIFSLFWPLGIIFITASWLVYGIALFLYFSFWFVFAGGMVKLLGLA